MFITVYEFFKNGSKSFHEIRRIPRYRFERKSDLDLGINFDDVLGDERGFVNVLLWKRI